MDFWLRLKNAVKDQNTTQEWVAGKIGVPLSTFRKWMTRKTYPDIREGIAIAGLLETTAEYLVSGVHPESLSNAERKLINCYRKLSAGDRENVILAVNAWAGKK